MPYYLDNAFLLDNPWITVVGCGGTGGFVAEGLCRLFQGRQATIVLVDHDRVEPHNLLRQNFYAEDVGRFKSQALADRLAQGLPASRRLLGLRLPGGGLPVRWGPLPRPSLLRELPAHRLRRQRRSTAGDGRESLPGRPAPVAHRRGQRHQLGPGAYRQRRRPRLRGRTSLRRRDLLPAPRAHGAAPRPADGGVDNSAGRGLRGRPRPHRPGPDHQPDDGVAGRYRWSAAWRREPAPSWASTWTWSRGRSPRPTPPRRRWRGWRGPAPSQRPSKQLLTNPFREQTREEKPMLDQEGQPPRPPQSGRTPTAGHAGTS